MKKNTDHNNSEYGDLLHSVSKQLTFKSKLRLSLKTVYISWIINNTWAIHEPAVKSDS